jgi:uncharacterized membrane protein
MSRLGPITPVLEQRQKGPTTVLQFEKSVTLSAPLEQVFDYVADRSHLPTIWPSLIEVSDLKRRPTGGCTFAYAYKMAGLRLQGTGEDSEYVAKERIVTKLVGGLDGTITFRFERIGATTKAHLAVAYTPPAVLLQKVGEPFVAQLNEHEAELVLRNLKTHFEVGVPASLTR